MNCPSWNGEHGTTASGDIPSVGNTIACEPRLLGETIEVSFTDGSKLTGDCADTGGSITENRIDIFLATKEEAMKFGRQEVKISYH